MAETQAEYNLADAITQDTWRGIPGITVEINGAPPSVPLDYAKIEFRKEPSSGPSKLTLDSDGNGIVITDASNWEVTIQEVERLPLEVGTWKYDYRTIDANGRSKTYLRGSMKVLPRITKGGKP